MTTQLTRPRRSKRDTIRPPAATPAGEIEEDSPSTRPAKCYGRQPAATGTTLCDGPETAFLIEVYEAAEHLDPLRIQHEVSGAAFPVDELLDAIANLVIVAGQSDAPMAGGTNYLFTLACEVAHVIACRRHEFTDWRQQHGSWPAKFWVSLRLLRDEAERLLDPGPEPQPRVVKLQTAEELKASGGKDAPPLTREFLCRYYSLLGPDGKPDFAALHACQTGKSKFPTEQHMPPEDDGVVRVRERPRTGGLVDTADFLKQERDAPRDIDQYLPVPE